MYNILKIWIILIFVGTTNIHAETTFKSFYKQSTSLAVDWIDLGINIIFLDFESAFVDIAKSLAISTVKKTAKDYIFDTVITRYSYNTSSKNSKNMITLPLPQNTSGCDLYESAMKILEGINSTLPLSNDINQKIMKNALSELEPQIKESEFKKAIELISNTNFSDADMNDIDFANATKIQLRYYMERNLDNEEKSKIYALKALLSFNTYNYKASKKYSNHSIKFAKKAETEYTISAFIYATSLLYDEKPNQEEIIKYFKYSIVNEPDNPIVQKLFQIITDRMMSRFFDDSLDSKLLDEIFEVASIESIGHAKVENYMILLMKYLVLMEHENEKVVALMTTENKAIKNSPKRIIISKASLKNYSKLLTKSKIILNLLKSDIPNIENKQVADNINTISTNITKFINQELTLEKLVYKNRTIKKEKTSISNLVVSFGVAQSTISLEDGEVLYSDMGTLGFDCILENEIILKIGHYIYHYDENEKECISKKNEDILRWQNTKNIFEVGKKYSVYVEEIDTISDEEFLGKNITFTIDDIKDIENGKTIRKQIGSEYFVEFSKY